MKTKPIIFKAEMVRAILAGKKIQTRRIIKPQPENIKCPYGKIGDKLWIRENFYVLPYIWAQHHNEQPVHYSADVVNKQHIEDYVQKPSIHMPRWASRITLEVTDIRVERIQETQHQDAIAEGIERVGGTFSCSPWKNYLRGCNGEMKQHCSSPIRSFQTLWDSINSSRGFGWDKNPWVWVIEFKKLDPAK